jgi:hypothetical protein
LRRPTWRRVSFRGHRSRLARVVKGDGPAVSNCAHAAIDREVHACDEASLVRSEEQGGRRDLLRPAEPPERDFRCILSLELGDHLLGRRDLLENRRVDRARADRIDPDGTILQLRRPRADEGADCRLGGTVSAQAGDARGGAPRVQSTRMLALRCVSAKGSTFLNLDSVLQIGTDGGRL